MMVHFKVQEFKVAKEESSATYDLQYTIVWVVQSYGN